MYKEFVDRFKLILSNCLILSLIISQISPAFATMTMTSETDTQMPVSHSTTDMPSRIETQNAIMNMSQTNVLAQEPAPLPHQDDPLKQGEHLKVFELVKSQDADFIFITQTMYDHLMTNDMDHSTQSHTPGTEITSQMQEKFVVVGSQVNWSDLAANHLSHNKKIVIAEGVTVVVDGVFDSAAIKTMRVDGTLKFKTDINTAIKVETLVVNAGGRFEMGTANNRIQENVTARFIIADRGERNAAWDPTDISGGFIAHTGNVSIYGKRIDGHLGSALPLTAGTQTIQLESVPLGWKVGDTLVIPSTDSQRNGRSQDEVVKIRAIVGNAVTLESALVYDHWIPDAVAQMNNLDVRIPISNMNRNVIFESENKEDLSRRGHFMIMHAQTGVVIDGAAFNGMGRTDAQRVHTIPQFDSQGNLIPGTDSNTIGRYAVHFHVRSGATYDTPPHIFRNSAIWGSPKHGLAQHGAHMLVENNVTFQINGSHFFSENGSEIGVWKNNVAIRSVRTHLHDEFNNEPGRVRDRAFDFGHGGHGFWLQGGGIQLLDNYAFGHAGAGIDIWTEPIREGANTPMFLVKNLRNEHIEGIDTVREDLLRRGIEKISIDEVPFYAARNVSVGSNRGFMTYWHEPKNLGLKSVVKDSAFWENRIESVVFAYSHGLKADGLVAIGARDRGYRHTNGIRYTGTTTTFELTNSHIEGHNIGIEFPKEGENIVKNVYLKNTTNLYIHQNKGRDLKNNLIDLTLDSLATGTKHIHLSIPSYVVEPTADGLIERIFYDSPTLLYGGFTIDGVRHDFGAGKRLYHPNQRAQDVFFSGGAIPAINGLTNQEVWNRYGITLEGVVAPANTYTINGVDGLLGEIRLADPSPIDHIENPIATSLGSYNLRVRSAATKRVTTQAVHLEHGGWNIVSVELDGKRTNVLVYADLEGPKIELHPMTGLSAGNILTIPFSELNQTRTLTVTTRDYLGPVLLQNGERRQQVSLGPLNPAEISDGQIIKTFDFFDKRGNKSTLTITIKVTDIPNSSPQDPFKNVEWGPAHRVLGEPYVDANETTYFLVTTNQPHPLPKGHMIFAAAAFNKGSSGNLPDKLIFAHSHAKKFFTTMTGKQFMDMMSHAEVNPAGEEPYALFAKAVVTQGGILDDGEGTMQFFLNGKLLTAKFSDGAFVGVSTDQDTPYAAALKERVKDTFVVIKTLKVDDQGSPYIQLTLAKMNYLNQSSGSGIVSTQNSGQVSALVVKTDLFGSIIDPDSSIIGILDQRTQSSLTLKGAEAGNIVRQVIAQSALSSSKEDPLYLLLQMKFPVADAVTKPLIDSSTYANRSFAAAKPFTFTYNPSAVAAGNHVHVSVTATIPKQENLDQTPGVIMDMDVDGKVSVMAPKTPGKYWLSTWTVSSNHKYTGSDLITVPITVV